MKDIWTCACTSHLFNDSKNLQDFVTIRDGLYLSKSYVLINSDNLEAQSLSILNDTVFISSHQKWKNLCCVRCKSNLGLVEIPNKANQFKNQLKITSDDKNDSISNLNSSLVYKFWKHNISTQIDESLNYFRQYKLEIKISTDIINLMKISNFQRFIIRDVKTRDPMITLIVMSCNSLFLESLSHYERTFEKMMPIIKLTYHDCSSYDQNLKQHYLYKIWNISTKNSEIIDLNQEDIFGILNLLEMRNNKLIEKPFQFEGMKISYLYYFP